VECGLRLVGYMTNGRTQAKLKHDEPNGAFNDSLVIIFMTWMLGNELVNMNILKPLLVAVLICQSMTTYADIEIKPIQHPIDAWYEEKMAEETVTSTADMRNITNEARVKWDSEMNVVYKRLMKRLTPAQQITLRKAQQQWLKYRDTEGKAISEIVSSQQGTIHQLSGTHLGMQLVRSRALNLMAYEQAFEQ